MKKGNELVLSSIVLVPDTYYSIYPHISKIDFTILVYEEHEVKISTVFTLAIEINKVKTRSQFLVTLSILNKCISKQLQLLVL